MSVAVGLSFTGCGNSSNGGSTGPTFEQVPLINESYVGLTIKDDTSTPYLSLSLQSASNYCLLRIATTEGNWEDYGGTWTAIQSPNNTYQIQISDLSMNMTDIGGGNCTMTCNGPLVLTIPENKLEAYRNGESVNATLSGSFTHETSGTSSCKLNTSGTIGIDRTVTIVQKSPGPV